MSTRGVHRGDMFDDDPTIAAFARDLQDAAAASPAPAVGASLAAVLDGRAPAAVYPEIVSPARVRPARRSLRLRWAVAGAAFGIGAGSLGVAGALPGPVQRQVARMAEVVGVDLPDGRPDADPTRTTPVRPVVPPSTVVVTPTPSVVPPADRPVPSTVPEDPSNRGNREGRGRGDDEERGSDPSDRAVDPDEVRDELDDDRSGPSDAEDELGEDRDDDGDDDDGGEVSTEGEDRSGPGGGGDEPDEPVEDDGEDDDDVVGRLETRRNPSMVTDVHARD